MDATANAGSLSCTISTSVTATNKAPITVQAMIVRGFRRPREECRGQASGPTQYLPSEAPRMPMEGTLGGRERPLHCT